jgi:glucitol operon activator protein
MSADERGARESTTNAGEAAVLAYRIRSSMSPAAAVLVVVALAVGWVAQMALAYRQAIVFQRQVKSLKRLGPTATGRSGSRLKGIAYCALAVDARGRVAGALLLRGYTVFARPKPLPDLLGVPVQELTSRGSSLADRALQDAAGMLIAYNRREEEEKTSIPRSGVIDGRASTTG